MSLGQRPTPPAKLQRARELRRQLTIAERRAWGALRNRRMLGLKFRRQHVIDGFIVDFCCAELGLVLEIDGDVHRNVGRSAFDSARTAHLRSKGLRVLRIRNEEVTAQALERLLQELICRSPSPRCGEGDRR